MARWFHNLRVGKADVTLTAPSHDEGISEGNAPGSYESSPGHLPDGKSTAERSTSINPRSRDPIDPSMPNLSPA